jgi:hypothetical protein
MGVGGAHILGVGVLVVVVADLVRKFERFLADAAIFNLPMLVLFLGGKISFLQKYS